MSVLAAHRGGLALAPLGYALATMQVYRDYLRRETASAKTGHQQSKDGLMKNEKLNHCASIRSAVVLAMNATFSLHPRTALSFALSALAVACGGPASGGGHGASVGGGSGVGGSATGGNSSSGGRAAGSGGNTPLSGGAAGNGGSSGARDASGGTPASGGSSSTVAVSGGGASATGGAFASGGASAAGGAATGGMSGGALSYALLTNRNDNVRSGVNLSESVLTPAAVGGGHFGLLFSRTVDAQIYGQPLYMSGLAMPDGMSHNVVFVTTSHDSIYAFDADHSELKAPLWQKSLGTAGPTASFGCTDMTPEVGVSSTPVIDSTAGNLYVVSKGQEGTNWVQRLHVLDVKTGNERPGSPISITASVTGTGDGSSGGKVTFDPQTHLNRAGLLLEGGVVYLTFASHCDSGAYHGWVLGYSYDGATLTQTRVFNVSVNGSKGGIWQAGVGLSTDGKACILLRAMAARTPIRTRPTFPNRSCVSVSPISKCATIGLLLGFRRSTRRTQT
jgi:hypothetical protein